MMKYSLHPPLSLFIEVALSETIANNSGVIITLGTKNGTTTMQKEQLISSIITDLEQLPEVYLSGLKAMIATLRQEAMVAEAPRATTPMPVKRNWSWAGTASWKGQLDHKNIRDWAYE